MSITLPSCGVSTNADHETKEAIDEIDDVTQALIDRAKGLELDTPSKLPPGDAQSHNASGFAKILCSAVFITGLDLDFAAEAIGYFSSPYEERLKVLKRTAEMENKRVHVTLPNGVVRTAVYTGDQGCVCLAEGADKLFYTPKKIKRNLPEPETTAWPMGDVLPTTAFDESLNMEKVNAAVEAAFNPAGGLTGAFVVAHKGRIIGERYKDELDMHTKLESWSMGKSLTAIMLGALIHQGVYTLNQPAPIPEWYENDDDPRQKIRITDIMRMSSGIRFRAPLDPGFDLADGYPDHLYVYTGASDTYKYVANLPQEWEPNTVGRYRNCDPVLANYLVRLGVEGKGEDYHSFPQRAILDKIGVRNMIMETDPYGNFLLQGYEFATGRDWIRLGSLMLNDGLAPNGERILPEGYLDYAMTQAPAWEADGRFIYGGAFHWRNGDKGWPIPEEAIFMAGAGGQFTFIIPSHDLVVVRLGHYKGSGIGVESLKNALTLLMEAVPEK